jgi:hypothetical protein
MVSREAAREKNMDCKIKTETFADLERNYHACECKCAYADRRRRKWRNPIFHIR